MNPSEAVESYLPEEYDVQIFQLLPVYVKRGASRERYSTAGTRRFSMTSPTKPSGSGRTSSAITTTSVWRRENEEEANKIQN